MRLGESALLLEDDAPAEMSVGVVRVALQDAGQEVQGLVEVVRTAAPPPPSWPPRP